MVSDARFSVAVRCYRVTLTGGGPMTGSATAGINAQDRYQVLNQGFGRETMVAVPEWAWESYDLRHFWMGLFSRSRSAGYGSSIR